MATNHQKKKMKYMADFVANLQSKGRYTFTLADAKKMLIVSDLALKRSLFFRNSTYRSFTIKAGD
jgi:hypothetical protein